MTLSTTKKFRISRDGILFATGLLGIAYETLIEGGDKPTLLVLFGAMVGLPAFLRTDEKAADKAAAMLKASLSSSEPSGPAPAAPAAPAPAPPPVLAPAPEAVNPPAAPGDPP